MAIEGLDELPGFAGSGFPVPASATRDLKAHNVVPVPTPAHGPGPPAKRPGPPTRFRASPRPPASERRATSPRPPHARRTPAVAHHDSTTAARPAQSDPASNPARDNTALNPDPGPCPRFRHHQDHDHGSRSPIRYPASTARHPTALTLDLAHHDRPDSCHRHDHGTSNRWHLPSGNRDYAWAVGGEPAFVRLRYENGTYLLDMAHLLNIADGSHHPTFLAVALTVTAPPSPVNSMPNPSIPPLFRRSSSLPLLGQSSSDSPLHESSLPAPPSRQSVSFPKKIPASCPIFSRNVRWTP